MILDVVKTLCKSKGISVNKLEQELEFSQGSIGKMGDSVPKADRLYKIADYFSVPMETFFEPINKAEQLVESQKRLNAIRKENEEVEKQIKELHRVAAGDGCYNSQHETETIEADDGYEYAEVVGDSMFPVLQSGDIVKIQPQTETTPHDYTLVKVDGEHSTIKFVEIVSDGVWLRALNKEVYQDHFFTISEVMTLPVTILGKVVSFERKL